MSRQIKPYEKKLFEVVQEYQGNFYYADISKVLDEEDLKINVKKERKEMVGSASVSFPDGNKIDYEIRYNRIINLTEGYTLFVPGPRNK